MISLFFLCAVRIVSCCKALEFQDDSRLSQDDFRIYPLVLALHLCQSGIAVADKFRMLPLNWLND